MGQARLGERRPTNGDLDENGGPALASSLVPPYKHDHSLIANDALLSAVRALAYVEQDKVRRGVDYRNLGSEELGSVYESLLEQHPIVNVPARTFELSVAAGNDRKTTGSYYTPDSLVQCLLDSALNPVVEDRLHGKTGPEAEAALLAIKVCDPACGSGHFLIAAAHRLARRLARVRTGESEPSPADYQHALRDVIGRCMHGVDINPMAVELCKVSLWMEAIEPGRPLSFLDHHLQCGNALLGATPALLAKGIPDEALTPIEGDDKKLCTAFKKQNRDERRGQKQLFADAGPWDRLGDFATGLARLDVMSDDTPAALREKEDRYGELVRSADYLSGRFWADSWCAAFVWKKTKEFDYPITEEVFRSIERNPHSALPWLRTEVERLARQYQFFHWHLAFPSVFRIPARGEQSENEHCGWSGGFDVVLGNPPWERLKPEPAAFFTATRPEIANAPTSASRGRLLAQLETDDPLLYGSWKRHERHVLAQVGFLTGAGSLPLTATGKFNTGNVFVECSRNILSEMGVAGLLTVSGLATDESGKDFIGDVIEKRVLLSLYDFENRNGLFPGIHRSYRFSAITVGGVRRQTSSADFAFFIHDPFELANPDRHVPLSIADVLLVNPLSRNCPVFRTQSEMRIVKSLYQAADLDPAAQSVLFRWNVEPTFLFVMSDHSHLFKTLSDFHLGTDAPICPGYRGDTISAAIRVKDVPSI